MIDNKYDALQSKWKNEPKQSDLKKDYDAAQSGHGIFLADLDRWRVNLEGGPEIKARTGKSKHRPLLIRKKNEWKYPSLAEPFLATQDMFKINPRTAEDREAAKQNQLLLNYYIATKINKVKLVDDIVHRVVDEGTVIVKSGWNSVSEEKTVQVEKPVYASPEESMAILQQAVLSGQMPEEQAQAMIEMGEPMQIGVEMVDEVQDVLIENHPTFEVCTIENVIIDPTCNGDIKDAQFVIHDYELDLSTLKRQKRRKLKDGTWTGIYKNLKYIDFDADNTKYDEYSSDEKKTFVFADKARKKVRVSEYWGYWDIGGNDTTVPIVATWIGDVMVRLEKNPFAHGELPFSAATYMPVKNRFHGQPDGELLAENQESVGKMTRAAHDITSTQAIGQRLVDEQLFSSPSQWEAFNKGNDARFRTGQDPNRAIYKANVESVNPSLYNMIDRQYADADSLTGSRAFAGDSSKLGASATGVRSAMDASSKRELAILRRLSSQLFQDMARKTVVNIQALAREEEVIRITNTFVVVRREDIQGEFDLVVDVSTPEAENEKADRLSFLLQTGASSMDPGMIKIIYSELAGLWKMPDLAKKVEEFAPTPPSEEEQAMQQAQMENLALENKLLNMQIMQIAKGMEDTDSKIEERGSRAAENLNADIANKNAQEEERKARRDYYLSMAAKAEAETDVIDAEYLANDAGVSKREQQVNDMTFAEESKLEREQLKADTQLKNKVTGEK